MESLPPAYTAALFLFIAFGLIALAALAYALHRTPATRFALVVSLLVVSAVLALAPLVFLQRFLPVPGTG